MKSDSSNKQADYFAIVLTPILLWHTLLDPSQNCLLMLMIYVKKKSLTELLAQL